MPAQVCVDIQMPAIELMDGDCFSMGCVVSHDWLPNRSPGNQDMLRSIGNDQFIPIAGLKPIGVDQAGPSVWVNWDLDFKPEEFSEEYEDFGF